MANYRLSVDLVDLYPLLLGYDLRDYRLPFSLYILEADNADDACHEMMIRIMRALLKRDNSIETRVICRKIRRCMRIDKVECL